MQITTANEPISNVADALAQLGVTASTLTDTEKAQIDRDGFIVFEQLISREQAAQLAGVLDKIAAAEDDRAGTDFHTEPGTTRLGNLVSKSDVFDICFTHPKTLAAVNYIARGNFGVSSVTGRAALPGEGEQPLHVDFEPAPNMAANILWALDDFTAENGPTRLVPGSQRFLRRPDDAESTSPQPGEVRLIVPAGTAAVIDAGVWHAGTRNGTDKARHLLSVMCQPRNRYQDWADRRISAQTAARLSGAALYILDHQVAE